MIYADVYQVSRNTSDRCVNLSVGITFTVLVVKGVASTVKLSVTVYHVLLVKPVSVRAVCCRGRYPPKIAHIGPAHDVALEQVGERVVSVQRDVRLVPDALARRVRVIPLGGEVIVDVIGDKVVVPDDDFLQVARIGPREASIPAKGVPGTGTRSVRSKRWLNAIALGL